MASISYFPPRKNWRVSYTIYLRDGALKRAKYAGTKADAKWMMGLLNQLEQKTKNRLATQDEIDDWIHRGWMKEEEASRIFDGYTEAVKKRKPFLTTDFEALLDAFKDYWLAKTDRDVIQKNLGSDMSHSRDV